MLTFLNSAILFGLAAVSIPILIHLFTRQKKKIVNFSSLRFLKELQHQQIRKLKIKQILLLILRALLVLTLVLAFARPTLKTSSASSLESGAQLTTVIILDNTLSMGRISEGRPLLEQAKDRALRVLSVLRPGDEIYLMYPQKPTRFAHEGARYSKTSIEALINNTQLSFAGTDYIAALITANKIMQESQNINKEVYLISDLQKSGFDLPADGNIGELLDDDVKLFVLPVQTESQENLSISQLSVGNQILEKDKVADVTVRVQNNGGRPVKGRLAHLFVNGKRIAQNVVDLSGGAAANLHFRMVPDKTGFQSGYVLLEDDLLSEDNKRYFAYDIADQIPILLVGNAPTDTRFLKLALRPAREVASYLKITETPAAQLDDIDLNKHRVVVLVNVPRLSSAQVQRLQSFVKAGGGLMVILGEDVDLRNYNDHLHKKLKLPGLTQILNEENRGQFLSMGEIDFSHPIFRGVFEKEKFVESPHVKFAVDIDARIPVDKIIKYSNGMTFLFESKLQAGRILYLTTSLDQKWSDLIFKGFFVPLVNRSAFYLAGAASAENDQIGVGGQISYQSEDLAASAELAIEKPDGNRSKVKAEISKGRFLLNFNETNLPGIYKLFSNDKMIAQWACNYDPVESQGATLDLDLLQNHLHDGQLVEIGLETSIVESLQQSRFGQEFWQTLLVMAVLFLLIETLLSRSKTATVKLRSQST